MHNDEKNGSPSIPTQSQRRRYTVTLQDIELKQQQLRWKYIVD